MEKTIKRELSAIEHKFNSMVDEYNMNEKERIEDFFDRLEKIRCEFSIGDVDNMWSIHLDDGDTVIIAVSRKKAKKELI